MCRLADEIQSYIAGKGAGTTRFPETVRKMVSEMLEDHAACEQRSWSAIHIPWMRELAASLASTRHDSHFHEVVRDLIQSDTVCRVIAELFTEAPNEVPWCLGQLATLLAPSGQQGGEHVH
jgi:hypothetical protein